MKPLPDRRSRRRFRIPVRVLYRQIFEGRLLSAGAAQTVDVSSSGILLAGISGPLLRGVPVELSLSWPVLLDETVPIALHAEAFVVRVERERVALQFRKTQFHTARRAA